MRENCSNATLEQSVRAFGFVEFCFVVFSDMDRRFNLPTLTNVLPLDEANYLHTILKPFLLRRMKTDVEMRLQSKEHVIYAPLTVRQSEAYGCVLEGRIEGRIR